MTDFDTQLRMRIKQDVENQLKQKKDDDLHLEYCQSAYKTHIELQKCLSLRHGYHERARNWASMEDNISQYWGYGPKSPRKSPRKKEGIKK